MRKTPRTLTEQSRQPFLQKNEGRKKSGRIWTVQKGRKNFENTVAQDTKKGTKKTSGLKLSKQ